jgi:acetyl-CoA C-acetyltransferase
LKKYKLQPKAVILDSEWSALDPSVMGLGPVFCSTEILKRYEYALSDIDLWELNEALAAQVLGCLAAWENEEF